MKSAHLSFVQSSGHLFPSLCDFSRYGSFQVMEHVPVGFASAIRTGRGKTVTVLLVRTPVCPVWVCCAVGVASVFVEAVSALSPGPTAPPATNVLLVLTPARWRSECVTECMDITQILRMKWDYIWNMVPHFSYQFCSMLGYQKCCNETLKEHFINVMFCYDYSKSITKTLAKKRYSYIQ